MKRLIALILGGLGLGALLRRRRAQPAASGAPADELKAKLAETRAEPEQAAEPEAPQTVEERRADVHAAARRAIDELGDESQ